MITKRRKTFQKNQRKRSKKIKIIDGVVNPILGKDGICYKDNSKTVRLINNI